MTANEAAGDTLHMLQPAAVVRRGLAGKAVTDPLDCYRRGALCDGHMVAASYFNEGQLLTDLASP
jgi:hypothetical protein